MFYYIINANDGVAGHGTDSGNQDGLCKLARFHDPYFVSISPVDGRVFVLEHKQYYRVLDCGLKPIFVDPVAESRAAYRLELFNTKMFADVSIHVKNDVVVRAHSSVLYECGGFFLAALRQSFRLKPSAKKHVISLQDYHISETQLMLLLKWVYAESLHSERDVLRDNCNPEITPLEMYRIAHCLQMQAFEEECLAQFAHSITQYNYRELSNDAHRLESTVNGPRDEIYRFFQNNHTLAVGSKRCRHAV